MFDVIGRVFADDVNHRGVGLAGVVQVGNGIAEPGAKMQQCRCRLSRHSRVAVCRAGHHALEQAQQAIHAIDLVQGGDEMHLRCAGVCETDIHATIDQCPYQAFGTIHSTFLP